MSLLVHGEDTEMTREYQREQEEYGYNQSTPRYGKKERT